VDVKVEATALDWWNWYQKAISGKLQISRVGLERHYIRKYFIDNPLPSYEDDMVIDLRGKYEEEIIRGPWNLIHPTDKLLRSGK
jgi:hypothetical protein